MSRRKTNFEESAKLNNLTYTQYINRLTELSTSMFAWENLPSTVDERYIEMTLFQNGCAVYFRDDDIDDSGRYMCLSVTQQSNFDVYGNPINRRAYSKYNNYTKELTDKDSVLIWNNYLRTNSVLDVKMFAKRLYTLDRIIDVNANAQKTPVLIQGSTEQRLTLVNLYKEFDGNAPVIFGDKNIDLNTLKVLTTNAPYIADKVYQLKVQIWNEALTYLGISNINTQKKERMITDEVERNQGGVVASRYSRLEMRRKAAREINEMFGTNIEVNYREDYRVLDEELFIPDIEESSGGNENE